MLECFGMNEDEIEKEGKQIDKGWKDGRVDDEGR